MITRTRWTVAAGAAIAVVALAAGGILLANRSSSSAGSCASLVAVPGTPTESADQAPGGGGLRIAEKGFSRPGQQVAGIGAIIENTSFRAAYRTQVTIRLVDATGESAVPDESGELLRQEIPVIKPGEKVPVGAWTYVRRTGSGRYATVAEAHIDLGATRWVSGAEFAPVTASDPQLKRSPSDASTGSIRYSLSSGYCDPLYARGVAMVFRNGTGAVVGGSFDTAASQDRCQPGTAPESAFAFRSVPDGVDESKIQVLTYCDVAPRAVTSPGGPIN